MGTAFEGLAEAYAARAKMWEDAYEAHMQADKLQRPTITPVEADAISLLFAKLGLRRATDTVEADAISMLIAMLGLQRAADISAPVGNKAPQDAAAAQDGDVGQSAPQDVVQEKEDEPQAPQQTQPASESRPQLRELINLARRLGASEDEVGGALDADDQTAELIKIIEAILLNL